MKFFIFSFLVLSFSARGQELYEPWLSARALGMGNAYTAVVRNADALFYNPAGLARVNGVDITLFDIHLAGDDTTAYQQLANLKGASTFASAVNNLYGQEIAGGVGGKSAVAIPGFAAAIYDNITLNLLAHNPPSTYFDTTAIEDFGYALGGALNIGPFFQFGVDVKRIRRTGVSQPIGPSLIGTLNPTTIEGDVVHEGVGYEMDAGANAIIPGPAEIVLSATWRNIGQTEFNPDTYGQPPPPDSQNEVTFGGSATFHLPLIAITPAVDFRYLNREDIQFTKKVNFGVEVSLPLIDLRTGFSQGYLTYGVGMDLGILRVDAASYGVELGQYAGQFEDRRYIAQVTLELDFGETSNANSNPSGGRYDGDGSGANGSGTGGSASKSGFWGTSGPKQRR